MEGAEDWMGRRTHEMGGGDQKNKVGGDTGEWEAVGLQSVGCGFHLVKKEGKIKVWLLGRIVILLVGR